MHILTNEYGYTRKQRAVERKYQYALNVYDVVDCDTGEVLSEAVTMVEAFRRHGAIIECVKFVKSRHAFPAY